MPPLMLGSDKPQGPALVRGLGTFDGALITIGSIDRKSVV
jgi:hypothetical protein